MLTALISLKQNNPLYADIDINENWREQAVSNDGDLFNALVQQSDSNQGTENMNSESVLPTQQPHNECSIDKPDSSSNQSINSFSSDNESDVFTIAFNVLEQVTKENGFTIHDVPYDGDCLFSSIAY